MALRSFRLEVAIGWQAASIGNANKAARLARRGIPALPARSSRRESCRIPSYYASQQADDKTLVPAMNSAP